MDLKAQATYRTQLAAVRCTHRIPTPYEVQATFRSNTTTLAAQAAPFCMQHKARLLHTGVPENTLMMSALPQSCKYCCHAYECWPACARTNCFALQGAYGQDG